jgi:hypothetical protein
MTLLLPRYVVAKTLADGRPTFYFQVPGKYRKLGCTVANYPLGRDYAVACGENGDGGRAAALNAHFDEWQDARRGLPITGERAPIYGTVKWLFQEYRRSKAYTEKVATRSRPDYERTMLLVEDVITKKGDKIGDRRIRAITPISADKIYGIILAGPDVERPRQAEKAVTLCRRAWSVVHRLFPREFDRDVPNPWSGVTMQRRGPQLLAMMFMLSRGVQSRGDTPRRLPPRLFATSGFNGPKMYWQASSDGRTTAARNGRAPLRFSTTRPERPSGTR